MIFKHSLCLLALFWLPTAVHAQQKKAPAPIQIRAVLHDPVHPTAELFLTDQKGAVVKIEFRPIDLSSPQLTVPINGSLVLYDKAVIDPEKPKASLAASCKIPPNAKKGVIIVLPGPPGTKPAYRMKFIDDSAKGFPAGESRVVSLLAVEVGIEAGEHKLPIHPGKTVRVPPVKKVDEYNMAQTNFHYLQEKNWIVFTERQLQFLDDFRRIFIVHVTPGALQPTVTIIVDTTTP